MNRISVKAARQPAAIGHQVLVQGWVRTRRDSKGRLQLPRAQRRLVARQLAGHRRRRRCRTTKPRSSTSPPAAASPSKAKSKPRGGKGQATEVLAEQARSSTAGPTPKPIRCKRSSTRSSSSARSPTCGRAPTPSAPSPASATASAAAIHNFFQEAGLPLHPHADHHRQRLRRGRARCSASPRSTWTSCRATDGKVDYAHDFFGKPGVPHRQRPARRRNLRLLARQDLHLRPDVPRRELATPRGTWPSSGWSSRRWPSTT